MTQAELIDALRPLVTRIFRAGQLSVRPATNGNGHSHAVEKFAAPPPREPWDEDGVERDKKGKFVRFFSEAFAEWDESQHDRDHGKFAPKGRGTTGGAPDHTPASPPPPADADSHTALRLASTRGGRAVLALGTKAVRIAAALDHRLMYPASKVREIAAQAATERGLDADKTKHLTRLLHIADFLGGYASGIAGGAVGGLLGAKVGAMLPVASIGYLLYSTAKNPKATWRAAKAVVRRTLGLDPATATHSDKPPTDLTALAKVLADGLAQTSDPDAFAARFLAALGMGATPEKAADAAGEDGARQFADVSDEKRDADGKWTTGGSTGANQPESTKPARKPRKTGHPGLDAALDAYHSATGKGKEYLEAALWNADIENPAKPPKAKDIDDRKLARCLASTWDEVSNPDRGGDASPEELAPLEAAMRGHGMESTGEPGEEIRFDGRYMEGKGGIFTGDVARVVRPGWVRPEDDGKEYILLKAKVEKAGQSHDSDNFAEDAQGHEHRGKGKGGGQFVKKGVGGDTGDQDAPKEKKPGKDATPKANTQQGGKTAKTDAARRAKFTGATVGAAEHEHADRVSNHIAQSLGGKTEEQTADAGQKDKKPYDVQVAKRGGGAHDIEVKSLLKGNKDGVSVHEDALLRKVNHAAAHPQNTFHLVVSDERDRFAGGEYKDKFSGHRLYYKRGAGRYMLKDMHPVKDEAELKRLLNMPDEKLPEKAQGSLPPPPPVDVLAAAAAAAAESRKARDKRRKEANKDKLREQARARAEKARAAKLAAQAMG